MEIRRPAAPSRSRSPLFPTVRLDRTAPASSTPPHLFPPSDLHPTAREPSSSSPVSSSRSRYASPPLALALSSPISAIPFLFPHAVARIQTALPSRARCCLFPFLSRWISKSSPKVPHGQLVPHEASAAPEPYKREHRDRLGLLISAPPPFALLLSRSSRILEIFAGGLVFILLRFRRHRPRSASFVYTVGTASTSRSRSAHPLHRRTSGAPTLTTTEALRRNTSPPTIFRPHPLASKVATRFSVACSFYWYHPFDSPWRRMPARSPPCLRNHRADVA